ncbi:MAG: NTP transferase domain-containing protein [Candidatus Eisenbacteria bacterium]
MNVGVMLAAGASRRMGRNKSLMRAEGQTFFVHGVRHLWSACDAVVVVLGADAKRARVAVEEECVRLVKAGALHGDLETAHRHGAPGLEVRFVTNRAWRRGMLSSARLGLRAALRLKPEAVLVLPVDHPAVKPATVRALAAAMKAALGSYRGVSSRRAGFAYALVPRYRRRRGHPLALSPALARAVAADTGATDLSDAVRRNARLVGYLDCGDAGVVRNRNTPGAR